MKSLKFIHCADLHLDSPFVGLKLPRRLHELARQSTFSSFTRIVNKAIEEEVDFLVIAGDLYDGEDRSIRAQIYFRNEMEKLAGKGIPVFIVHGNHDHLSGNWTKLKWPDNVFVFPGDVKMIPHCTKDGVRVHLYGFSYAKRHVRERMISHYRKEEGADFHIGILHGHDSKNGNHYSYAPFTVKELAGKGFDYWALGHIHQRQVLKKDPLIIYPGNIQGRHRNETGEKGCYLIEMSEKETKASFIETAPIRFERQKLDLEHGVKNFDDFYGEVMNVKDEWRQKGKHIILTLGLSGSDIDSSNMHWFETEELLPLLNDGEEEQDPFVWIQDIDIDHNDTEQTSFNKGYFYKELVTELERLDHLHEPLKDLFNHPRTKKYIDGLTTNEEKEIREEAEKLLFRLLRKL